MGGTFYVILAGAITTGVGLGIAYKELRHGLHPYDWTGRVRRVWVGARLFN